MKRKQTSCLFSLLVIVMLFGMVPTAFVAENKDVSENSWYHTARDYVTGYNLMAGISGERFEPETPMTCVMLVMVEGTTTVFELNDSQAAMDLYAQLPLTIVVENYSNNEKIFYPPKKLDTANTPLANAQFGTLAYYAPWGDVVMFYGNFGSASGLYELGNVISGSEYIRNMSGTIQIEKMEAAVQQ